MKTRIWIGALALTGLTCFSWALAQQELFFAEPIEEPRPVFDLPLVSPESAPEVGTFWLYSSSADGAMPPYPFDPYAGLIPMYAMPGLPGQYLIADTSTDYAQLQAISLQMAQLESGGGMMSMSLPEFPGEDDTNGSGGGTWEYTPIVHGSNDFWLEMVSGSVTNGTAQLLIHNPVDLTNNPVWDIFATTNLNLDAPGLNATNWTWLLRTAPGQTNLTVPMLSDWQCYYRAGDTNDLDGDGLSDLRELWETHSSPSTNDTDGDGLLDAWEWNHFGNFAETDTGDYDNDGTSNLSEQSGGTNPNDIRFRLTVTNLYVNALWAPVTAEISGGVPGVFAVVVDGTNFTSAQWFSFTSSNLLVQLASEGWHDVWLGLHGRTTTPTTNWQYLRLKRDTLPPQLTFTLPMAQTSQPLIQLLGHSDEDLTDIRYTLGSVTNERAFITRREHSASLWDYTTNHFQAYDVELSPGTNLIQFTAADHAGNVATTNVSLVLAPDTNAPALTLTWPRPGMRLAGSQCTLRGVVDDPTAQIIALVPGTNSVTNVVTGLVERDGKFWVENVPLQPGTNAVTLIAVDAWTNSLSTNVTLIRSAVSLTINPVDSGSLWSSSITASGTVSDPSYAVWVNGVAATVDSNGSWSASNVELSGEGTASQDVTIYPPGEEPTEPSGNEGENPDSPNSVNDSLNQDRPARIFISKDVVSRSQNYAYHIDYWDQEGAPADWTTQNSEDSNAHAWADGQGGSGTARFINSVEYSGSSTNYVQDTTLKWPASNWPELKAGTRVDVYNGTGTQTNVAELGLTNQHCAIAAQGRFTSSGTLYGGPYSGYTWAADNYEDYALKAETETKLFTGGKSVAKRKTLWELTGWVDEIRDQFVNNPYLNNLAGIWPVPPEQISIGQFGKLNTNRLVYAEIAKGTTVNISATTEGPDHYAPSSFGSDYQLKLYWGAADVTDSNVVCWAGQPMNLRAVFEPYRPAGTVTNYQWTVPGPAYADIVYTATNGSVYALTNLTTNTVNFYWTKEHTAEVTCSVKVDGTLHTAKATFEVRKPDVSWVLTPKHPVAVTNRCAPAGTWTGQWLTCGLGCTTNDEGMVFSFSNINLKGYQSFSTLQVVQLVATTIQENFWVNSNLSRTVSASGLDSLYPYESSLVFPWNLSGGLLGDDSPGEPLNGTQEFVSRADSFQTFLLFQPEGGKPIPLRLATWSWSGSAIATNAPPSPGYVLGSSTSPSAATGSLHDTPPEWSANIRDLIATNSSAWTTNDTWYSHP